MPETVIVDAVRTPIGRFGGGLKDLAAGDLAAMLIAELVDRNQMPPAEIDEVILGQVIQGGSGANVARTAAVEAGLPVEVCGSTINMMCASGMRAIDMARRAIALEEGDILIAGGTESMSRAPFYVRELRWGHRLGSVTLVDAVMDEGLRCPITGMGMGMTAEEIADRTGITREEMDAWALRSQQRARAAIASGRFADEIVPVPREGDEPLEVDEHPRETSMEALAALKPAFTPDGCVTAGNASGINDAGACLVLASREWAEKNGKKILATVVAHAAAGLDPAIMGMGPYYATKKVLEKTGLKIEDFDVIEANEAFASQCGAVAKELPGFDLEKINLRGGAIALGHPIGASGARIITTLLYQMLQEKKDLGLATMCIGGGQGTAIVLRREK